MLKVLEFKTSNEGAFLVSGVPNAKYLAFGTSDTSALRAFLLRMLNAINAKF